MFEFFGVYGFMVKRKTAYKAVLRRPGRQRLTRAAFQQWWHAQEYGLAVRARFLTMWCNHDQAQ